jgi:hypothetical protein
VFDCLVGVGVPSFCLEEGVKGVVEEEGVVKTSLCLWDEDESENRTLELLRFILGEKS